MDKDMRLLLSDCLSLLESLNNANIFTRSLPLRNHLREALNRPLEVQETVPEMALCPTCGDYLGYCTCADHRSLYCEGCGAYAGDTCQCGNCPTCDSELPFCLCTQPDENEAY